MKTIQTILFCAIAAIFVSSCETADGGARTYPEPNRAQTSQKVQEMHSQIHRQNF